MSRPIDKTKKSNIKCEHCKYWCESSYPDGEKFYECLCLQSENYKRITHYYNRCKQFEWEEQA